MSDPAIRVEVVYALRELQVLERVVLPAGSTVEAAIRASGLLERYADLDLARVGIFGKATALSAVLREGDRVELYRPLTADPKETRRRRATRQKRR